MRRLSLTLGLSRRSVILVLIWACLFNGLRAVAYLGCLIVVTSGHSGSRISPVKSELATLSSGLQNFRLDCDRYPTNSEGLAAVMECPRGLEHKWKGPYLMQRISSDPWGNPYVYACPGPNGVDSYLLESYGSDGAPGGDGDAADVIEGSL